MRYIFLLLIFISCSPKKDFVLGGDWKLENIFKEGEKVICKTPSGDDCPVMITSYRSDNLVFFYNNLLTYNLEGDSLFFFNEQTGKLQNAFRLKIIDDKNYSLTFIRRLKIDSTNTIDITYKSLWSKVE